MNSNKKKVQTSPKSEANKILPKFEILLQISSHLSQTKSARYKSLLYGPYQISLQSHRPTGCVLHLQWTTHSSDNTSKNKSNNKWSK